MMFLFSINSVVIGTLLILCSNVATAFTPSLLHSSSSSNARVSTSSTKCNHSMNNKIHHDTDRLVDDVVFQKETDRSRIIKGNNDVTTTSRGAFLLKVLSNAAMVSLPLCNVPLASNALESTSSSILLSQEDDSSFLSEFSVFQDDTVGFQIKIPVEWKKSEQSLPDRRKIVLFVNEKVTNDDNNHGAGNNDGEDKDLMFIAYTPVRDDFTSLSSFGSVDQVAQMTILPKGQIAGQDSESKMILAEAKKNSYYFDYVSQPAGQPKRHFRTIFTLIQGATGGAGAVLVTITVQTTEGRYDRLKPMLDEIMNSYSTTTTRQK